MALIYLKVGSHSHSVGECAVSIYRETNRVNGQIRSTTHRWSMAGRVHADSQSALDAAIAAIEDAYRDGVDVGLYYEDNTPTAHLLPSGGSLGGTRILRPPDFPVGNHGQHTSYRDFFALIEAEYPGGDINLLSYSETLSFFGNGGPEYWYPPVLNGIAPKFMIRQATTFKAIQQGEAIGMFGVVLAPGPLWPADEIGEARRVSIDGGRRLGSMANGSYQEFRSSWNYQFESNTPLIGLPHAWPG